MLQTTTSYENTCIRCGKMRVTVKEWTETNEENGIKSRKSTTVCPDPECQEEVNKLILSKQNDRERKENARKARLAKINERFAQNQ